MDLSSLVLPAYPLVFSVQKLKRFEMVCLESDMFIVVRAGVDAIVESAW
jgi:hypothetical protein